MDLGSGYGSGLPTATGHSTILEGCKGVYRVVKAWVQFVGPSDFSVRPSPLGTDLELGLTGFGLSWVRGRA